MSKAYTDALREALKKLTFAARISGGTAGRDEGLCKACDDAETALSLPAEQPEQETVAQDADARRMEGLMWALLNLAESHAAAYPFINEGVCKEARDYLVSRRALSTPSGAQQEACPVNAEYLALAKQHAEILYENGGMGNQLVANAIWQMHDFCTHPTPGTAAQGEREAGLYVASRVKHAKLWQTFRAAGVLINSSWIDEAGDGETDDFEELWARIETEIRRSVAVVLYVNEEDFPLKGALIECGMALAMGKPVFVSTNAILEGRTMRPLGSWILDRRVTMCDSLDAAIAAAIRTGKQQ